MQALISNLITTGKNRAITLFLILLLPFMMVTNCSKDKFVAKEYPRVITISAARINDSSVTFTGELISGDLSQITEYGFVWSEFSPSPYLETGEKVTFTGSPGGKQFSGTTQDLVKGKSFYLRCYVKTGSYLSYGNVLNY